MQRRERHIAHRLKSIAYDARRLETKLGILEDNVEEACARGVLLRFLANERCGSWYLPARSYFRRRQKLLGDDAAADSDAGCRDGDAATCEQPPAPSTCYFKSSDGHYGQWSFSHTRLNLGLVKPLLCPRKPNDAGLITPAPQMGSITVIVDATQHGKAYPDALSKTIPIWACVMNRAYHHDLRCEGGSDEDVRHMLPTWLHPSEAHSILQQLLAFTSSFKNVCPTPSSPDAVALAHPFTIMWLHGEDSDDTWESAASVMAKLAVDHHVLVLVCASGDASWRPQGDHVHSGAGSRQGWSYVRGAADDHQSWGMGLTCDLFWDNVDALTNPQLSLDEVEEVVRGVVAATTVKRSVAATTADEAWKALLDVMRAAQPIAQSSKNVALSCVLGVEEQSPLSANPSELLAVLEGCLVVGELSPLPTNAPALIFLVSAKLKDPAPRCTTFRTLRIMVMEVDACSTKFGIQRSLAPCFEWLDEVLQSRSTTTASPSHDSPIDTTEVQRVVLVCLDAERDTHVVAAISVAMLTHLDDDGVLGVASKSSIRAHQAVVADALGGRAIHRSDMTQVNRHFLSKDP